MSTLLQVLRDYHKGRGCAACAGASRPARRTGCERVVHSPDVRLLLIGLLAAAAAFAQKVDVEFDPSADFTRFHTFAIRDGRLSSRNPALNSELVRKQIDADIRRSMEARGFVFVESGASDLNVRYTLGAARRTEVERYPAGWRGWGTRVVRVPYTEGTLVIDLRDPRTRSLVWRAIAREAKSDPNKIQGRLDAMVKKAFDKYPPKAK